ncbi:MAG: Crp/Fnr family transcriptional regulator [bacterium]|nr:Crp/Fnr family transcriptional regulator [bacterium]
METKSLTSILDTFFDRHKLVRFKRGQVLIRPSDELKSILYLKTGLVKMYALSEDGDEITLHLFMPPSFFPIMMALLGKNDNAYYYEAIEDSEGRLAPKEEVLQWLKTQPDVVLDLSVKFSAAIMGLLTRIEGMAFQGAYPKMISLLLYMAEKFGKNQESGVIIKLQINHQEIASWLGIRRETASRQLERLQKEELLIIKDQHFFIPSIQKLKDVINITAE